ncbi:MAG: ATP-binding protein [bacterium]
MQSRIYKRKIVEQILPFLDTDNILVLHGARQVGKSSILKYLQSELTSKNKPNHYLDLEDSRNLDLLNGGVDTFLQYLGEIGFNLNQIQESNQRLFVFIDEIQYLQNPSSFLKLIVDHHKYIQLIVSGSSSFAIKSKFKDSLVGRTIEFVIYNLSFEEYLEFKGFKYDLENLKTSKSIDEVVQKYYDYIYYGGYPKVVLTDDIKIKERILLQIVDTYVRRDIMEFTRIGEISKFNNLIKLLAEQSGQLLNVSKLASLCSLSRQTVENYLFLLENTYIIKLLSPFSSSRGVEISKASKIYFYDTGLMQAIRYKSLSKNVLGNSFETSIFAELVKKYDIAEINFWRTKSENEVDFILNNKEVLPLEVKLNFKQFRLGSMQEFLKKYTLQNYRVVGLEGGEIVNGIYPWQI